MSDQLVNADHRIKQRDVRNLTGIRVPFLAEALLTPVLQSTTISDTLEIPETGYPVQCHSLTERSIRIETRKLAATTIVRLTFKLRHWEKLIFFARLTDQNDNYYDFDFIAADRKDLQRLRRYIRNHSREEQRSVKGYLAKL